MELDTWRHVLSVGGEFHSTSLLVPVRASEDYVGKIFRFLLTADTQLSHMKSTVRANFVPNTS
eukprot:3396756-Amphidinium_carterae.1